MEERFLSTVTASKWIWIIETKYWFARIKAYWFFQGIGLAFTGIWNWAGFSAD